VIAEYERAKIAERYRRGKLFRSRAGEVLAWRTPYGYRRLPRDAAGPARLEIYEPEAAVVRRIFADTVAGGHSTREIARRLAADQVPTPTGRGALWGTSTIGRLLRNEAYIGRVYFNRTESVPDPRPGRKNKQIPRPQQDWITIPVPAIVTDDVFTAAGGVSRDNSQWSPRRTEPGQWLLRGLVRCGACGVGTNCHKMRGRNGTWHRYYYCRNHDPLRAGGQDRRCPERNIRSDALDTYVFNQVRAALLRPETLLAGERAVASHAPTPDDELLAVELTHLNRKLIAADDERRRLVDLYQAGLVALPDLQRRAADVERRRRELTDRRDNLAAQRRELTRDNQLRQRVTGFAQRVLTIIDQLDFQQKQDLLRLVVDEVRVTGWTVQIQLRIALDDPGGDPPPQPHPGGDPPPHPPQPPADDQQSTPSTEDRLRSLGGHYFGVVNQSVDHRGGDDVVAEDLAPPTEGLVGGHDQGGPFVAGGHELEEQVPRFGFKGDVADLVDDDQGVAPQADERGRSRSLLGPCGPGGARPGSGLPRRGIPGRPPRVAGRRSGTPPGPRIRRGPVRVGGERPRAGWVPSGLG
jgi:hypothetical protein